MNFLEAKLRTELKSKEIVNKYKEKLIVEGVYPKKFSTPINLQLELTGNCNLRCKHCYNRSGIISHNDKVTPEKWVEFCHHLVAGGGIFQATISGGEPLLLGDSLWEIMDVLHNDGTIFNLISNGYLFSKDILAHLKVYDFYWIQISIDDFRAVEHDCFRGIKGSWAKAAKAAYLIALSGIPLRIATTVTPSSLKHLEELVKMAINLGATYYVIGEVMPSGRAYDNPDIILSDEEREFFYSEMKNLETKYKKDINILVSSSQRFQLEYAASESISGAIVRPNGDIRLDCSCPFVIGNILKDDIFEVWHQKADIWQHPEVKKYIQACDPNNGYNSYLENYNQPDIHI